MSRQLDSSVYFCLSSVATYYFVEMYEENPALQRHVVEKGSILIAFSDNCEYSSIILLYTLNMW